LFLLLDSEHGIFTDLGCRVANSVDTLRRYEAVVAGLLLQLLRLIVLLDEEPIKSSLAEEESLVGRRIAVRSITRSTIVHPVHAINYGLLSCGSQLLLDLLLLSFFSDLA
jgi:hypothetical protein